MYYSNNRMHQIRNVFILVFASFLSTLPTNCVWSFQIKGTNSIAGRSQQCCRLKGALEMRWGLKAKGVANKPTGDLPDGKTLRDSVPFELRGFSLPLVVFSIGTLLTASSFAGFFLNDGSSDGAVSSLGFVYGIPVFLIGLSLWYAEIKPVQVISSPDGDAAWDKYATDTFIKIKQDVTRHRYGDDAHLDSTLTALGLRIPQKKYPRMQSIIQEQAENGLLSFTMTFQSVETPYKVWANPERVRRYSKFFGPNVKGEVFKVDAKQRIVALKLTTIPAEEYEELMNSPIVTSVSEDKEEEEEDTESVPEEVVKKAEV